MLHVVNCKVWPYLGTSLIQTPIFECCVVGRGFRRQQRLLCLEEIRLSAENLLPILDSIVNITGGAYMTNHEFANLHFDCE